MPGLARLLIIIHTSLISVGHSLLVSMVKKSNLQEQCL